jgi:hypothetical protein
MSSGAGRSLEKSGVTMRQRLRIWLALLRPYETGRIGLNETQRARLFRMISQPLCFHELRQSAFQIGFDYGRVSILPASSGIVGRSPANGRTQRADPHSCPRRRNHQRADSLEMISITKHGAMRVQIAKSATESPPGETLGCRVYVSQARSYCRAGGSGGSFERYRGADIHDSRGIARTTVRLTADPLILPKAERELRRMVWHVPHLDWGCRMPHRSRFDPSDARKSRCPCWDLEDII